MCECGIKIMGYCVARIDLESQLQKYLNFGTDEYMKFTLDQADFFINNTSQWLEKCELSEELRISIESARQKVINHFK